MKPILNTFLNTTLDAFLGVFNLLVLTPLTLGYAVYVIISLVQVHRIARTALMLVVFANFTVIHYLIYIVDIRVWSYPVIYISIITNIMAFLGAMLKEKKLNAVN